MSKKRVKMPQGCNRRNPVFQHVRYMNEVDVCRNCNGKGYIEYFDDYDCIEENLLREKCKLCNGTGRVQLEGKSVLDIKPFEDAI